MVGPDSSHGISRVVRHKDFYLRGGDMTVLVESHLYRIHSYFFDRESLFFRQKLNSANNGDTEERGSTDNNAYTLEDVKSEDFARFLWVFYNPKYSVYEAPLETWLSILTLANRWTFDSVKELAVRELEKIEIESVHKISIYHDNSISRLYLIPSYIEVCKRDKPLSFVEGMKLGMETVLRIAEARERLRQQASESGIRSPTFQDFEDAEVEVLIREIFHLGSRPTSPAAVNAPNGTNSANSAPNGTIKLNPAPPGHQPKANGVSTPRANGGSAADPKGASVDPVPSIAAVLSPQAPRTLTPPASSPAPEPETRPTVSQDPSGQTPPASAPTVSTSPPPLPDKEKNNNTEATTQGQGSLASVLSPKSGGVGEPSSSGSTSESSGPNDVSVSKPVVPSSEHSDNLTPDPNDNVNEGDKDDSGKDPDTASVFSDTDGGKGKQGGKNSSKRGVNKQGIGRGARK